MEHSIPLMEGTQTLRQPIHCLCHEKEAEADRRVADQLQKGLREPVYGAWSFPLVIVKKKDLK